MLRRLFVALAASGLLVAGPGPAYGDEEQASPTPPSGVCAESWSAAGDFDPTGQDSAPIGPPLVAELPDTKEPPRTKKLHGKWKPIARSPFAAEYAASAWTGGELLVVQVDPLVRRAAAYDPKADRWRQLPRPPSVPDMDEAMAYTGDELLLLGLDTPTAIGGRISGVALDPTRDVWRGIASVEVTQPNQGLDSDGSVDDAVWTGERIVVVTSNRDMAAYDPEADCWEVLPPVPGERYASYVYWTGETILVETRGKDESMAIVEFDPGTGSWGEPVASPLHPDAAGGRAQWVDGRLVFLTWFTGGLDGIANAFYDPDTQTWEPFSHRCHFGQESGVIWAGRVLIDGNAWLAFDPRTRKCYRLPDRPRKLFGSALAWTGRDLISWSGWPGEAAPADPRGFTYRLPRWARMLPTPDQDAPTLQQVAVGREDSTRCAGVDPTTCQDVAALAVNNMAWGRPAGDPTIVTRRACPGGLPSWAIPSRCWQAYIPVRGGREVCMVIAKRTIGDYGQVAGDQPGRATMPDDLRGCPP